MKLKYLFGLGALGLVAFFLMAAAPPAPVWRNAWTTNAGAGPVHGASNLQITNDNDVIWNFFSGSTSTVARISDVNTATGNVANLFILNQSGSGSNLTLKSASTTTVPLIIQGIAAGTTNQLEIKDSFGNVVAYISTNGAFRTTNDFVAALQTTDNTTNSIYSFTPIINSMVRVEVSISGYNITNSASYQKTAAFRNVAGTVTQVGTTSTFGATEDDSAFEALIDVTGATTVRVRVAGDTARTVNWIAIGRLVYAQ